MQPVYFRQGVFLRPCDLLSCGFAGTPLSTLCWKAVPMNLISRRRITRFASGMAFAAVAAAVIIPSVPASAQTLFTRANCSIDGTLIEDNNTSVGNYEIVFAVDWPTNSTTGQTLITPRVFMQNLIATHMFHLDGVGTPDAAGVDVGHTAGEFTVVDPSGDEVPASIDAVLATPDGIAPGVGYSEGYLQSLTLDEAGVYELRWNRLSGTMTNTVDGVTESHDWECVPVTSPWTLASINVSGAETSNPPIELPSTGTNEAVVASGTALPAPAASPRLAETGNDASVASAMVGSLTLGAGLLALAAAHIRRRVLSQR
jgi:hypothetical protein